MADTQHGTIYAIKVDGRTLTTEDPKLTGRQVRSLAGAAPASDFILIMIADGAAQSVGLDRSVHLDEIASPVVFRLFRSDRTFSFTVNERGFEWGDAVIDADEIRQVARVPDDHDLILDSDGDRIIGDDDAVRLKGDGVERIVSRPMANQTITIIVNTRPKTISARRLTFTDLVALAFETPPSGENVCFTVSYRKGPKRRSEGSLLEGDSIRIKEGMVFNVSATDKS